jgi:hypothetical protein
MMVNKERRALAIIAQRARAMAQIYQNALNQGEITEVWKASRMQGSRDALLLYADAIDGAVADPDQWDELVQSYKEHLAASPNLGRGAEARH